MREILFRGKAQYTGEWVEGGYVKDFISVYIYDRYKNLRMQCVASETVGQYTGLNDKNGTKIFEGDILKGAWGTLIKIYYDESYLQFRAKEFTHRTIDHSIDYYGDNSRLEVVGNIYDNPELLEKRCEKR